MSDHNPSQSTSNLPPCGVYRTVEAIGDIPAGRLVYFHNHGNPGPGVYLPERWENNRAIFHEQGVPLAQPLSESVKALKPLAPEGFYRVREAFYCCDKRCNQYQPNFFVQLGYNGQAQALLFVPELDQRGIAIPQRGTRVDEEVLDRLDLLKVARAPGKAASASPSPGPGSQHLH